MALQGGARVRLAGSERVQSPPPAELQFPVVSGPIKPAWAQGVRRGPEKPRGIDFSSAASCQSRAERSLV